MSCQGQPLPGHFLHGHWLSGCEEWRTKLAGYLHWRGRWDATKPQFYGSRLVTIIGAMKEIAACAVRTMGFGTPTQLGFKAPNESKWIQNDATWNWQEKFSAAGSEAISLHWSLTQFTPSTNNVGPISVPERLSLSHTAPMAWRAWNDWPHNFWWCDWSNISLTCYIYIYIYWYV